MTEMESGLTALFCKGATHMGGLHPIDILILAIVSALSILVIVFRVRRRRKAKADINKCGGGCNSCGMSCGSSQYKKKPIEK